MDLSEIDPVKYGALVQRVDHMSQQMNKMEDQLNELVALANRGRGGLWFGMTVVSGLSGIIGFVVSHWKGQ